MTGEYRTRPALRKGLHLKAFLVHHPDSTLFLLYDTDPKGALNRKTKAGRDKLKNLLSGFVGKWAEYSNIEA